MTFQQTICVVGRVNHKTANFGLETCPGNAPTGAAWHVFQGALRSAYDWACQVRAFSFPHAWKGKMFQNQLCPKCGGKFEFAVSEFEETGRDRFKIIGQTVACPHCQNDVTLSIDRPPSPELPKSELIKKAIKPETQSFPKPIEKKEQIKKKIPMTSYIFVFIIGICLVFTGFDHVTEPDNESIMPQIYGAIEMCSGWIIIALAIVIESLARIAKNQTIK